MGLTCKKCNRKDTRIHVTIKSTNYCAYCTNCKSYLKNLNPQERIEYMNEVHSAEERNYLEEEKEEQEYSDNEKEKLKNLLRENLKIKTNSRNEIELSFDNEVICTMYLN